MKLGLTSVTFRKLSIQDICILAKKTMLNGIEWGGDVHVTCVSSAKIALEETKKHGLEIFSYGSYFKCNTDNYLEEFNNVIEIAKALEVKVVRIWAGDKDHSETDENYRLSFVERMQKCALIAKENNITLCFEHHKGTLCNNATNTIEILTAIRQENVLTYWQPIYSDTQENLKEIEKLAPKIVNAHVFHWKSGKRLPFKKGQSTWLQYINELGKVNKNIALIVEFVKSDSEKQFIKDAKILRDLLPIATHK